MPIKENKASEVHHDFSRCLIQSGPTDQRTRYLALQDTNETVTATAIDASIFADGGRTGSADHRASPATGGPNGKILSI